MEQHLFSILHTKKLKRRFRSALPLICLLAVLVIFWWLKLTGITMAGEAFCGKEEHIHTEECMVRTLICTQTEAQEDSASEDSAPIVIEEEHIHGEECYEISYICGMESHVHDETCYSDSTADLETSADWEATLPELLPDCISENIVAVARSQIGYAESETNYILDEEGIRRGYTRYGEWYGSPYGSWSTMFTSFCLRYGGGSDLPVSSGADALRIQWEEAQRYLPAEEYTPMEGDIVFLDKNSNGTPETTAIAASVTETEITVIEGDLENQVAEVTYLLDDRQITGYGITAPISLMSLAARDSGSGTAIGTITAYNASALAGHRFILYTQGSDGSYYAMDGNANAVPVSIDDMGTIFSETEDTDTLYWTFASAEKYDNQSAFYIQNVSTGKYLHPYNGVLIDGRWESALYPNGSGVRIRGARQNAYASLSGNATFTNTGTLNKASTFYFGQPFEEVTIWLDGTHGGIRSLHGSPNQSYQVVQGESFTLPQTWQSPTKYSYKIQGWFDLKNNRYYLPGEEVTVTESLVFYPDWVAETYDIGRFNAHTADTVSTDAHITTHVFDYNFLFNLHSANVTVNADSSGHSESWNLVTQGNVAFQGKETLDFVMTDNESSGMISKPNNLNDPNKYTGNSGGPVSNLYNETIAEALFSTDNGYDPATGTGILGKTYLGTGNHLFQFGSDPDSEYYGYYYFDSNLNGISYSQKDQRFYVYDYLQRTTDSGTDKTGDFLPLNSPYANTNDCPVETYSHNGLNGEYVGTTHYQYDIFRTNNNYTANLWFGMSIATRFYLPDQPGVQDADNQYGNKDVYGNDMLFRFSGDDDVWVLVDGQVVLDLGGIHRSLSGDINFSTGKVTVNGAESDLPSSITSGEHTLTIYYLERGGGQSNCLIQFNLAPRYNLTLQKEDVLTQKVLNGAQFSVYTDDSCKKAAQLWNSEESYNRGDTATNVFTIEDGKTSMWGLDAGKTYYIRETRPPDDSAYKDNLTNGIICLSLDKSGNASYRVEIITETDDNGHVVSTSPGFTVHGYRIDEESQQAFIVATNAPKWVQETTSIQAVKIWADEEDHSKDSVTAYLTVTDQDGTVRRIREVELDASNHWTYTWVNMPKYWADGITPIQYGVDEAYKSGYTATIEKAEKATVTVSGWQEAGSFETGKTYILKTSSGCLSATSASESTLKWVDESTAKSSDLAQWTASVTNNNVKLTNGAKQILSFNNTNNNRYFYPTKGSASSQSLLTAQAEQGLRLYTTVWSGRSTNYYLCSLNSNSQASASTSANNGLIFTPLTKVSTSEEITLEGIGFTITNTPLKDETSLTVTKKWSLGQAANVDYQQSQVTVKLFADGKDTGRTVTLNLKNNWTDTFRGLPYTDTSGKIISYTVEETWETDDWLPIYGEVRTVDPDSGKDTNPTYETTITNDYRFGHGVQLPSTGGFGQTIWVLTGFSLMLGSIIYGYLWKRKQEGGYPHA